MSVRSAAEQTAADVTDEFGAETEVDGGAVMINNRSGAVSPRVIYGYADTTAATLGLSVRYEQPTPGRIRVVYTEEDDR